MGRGPYLPRELRIKLYDEARRRRGQGLTYGRIIDYLRRRYGVVLRTSHISFWVRGIHSPYGSTRILSIESLRPSRELAYIIGVVAGDGYVWWRQRPRESYHEVTVGLTVKGKEFAEEFSRCLATVLKRGPIKLSWSKRQFVVVRVTCKALYELVGRLFNIEKVKRFVEHCSRCKSAFLKGFLDSEGCVSKKSEVIIYNTNLGLLEYVKQLLESLGIGTTGPHLNNKHGMTLRNPKNGKIYTKKRDVYSVYIPAEYRLRFYQRIGFTIERKQRRLEDYLIRTGRLKPPAKHSPIFYQPAHYVQSKQNREYIMRAQ
ncbi:MAG: LAGLIDADG family homing endonuclease [Nitrososphaerota archaeon]